MKGNPFHCNCKLEHLRSKLARNNSPFIQDGESIQCSTPLQIHNKALKSLTDLCGKLKVKRSGLSNVLYNFYFVLVILFKVTIFILRDETLFQILQLKINAVNQALVSRKEIQQQVCVCMTVLGPRFKLFSSVTLHFTAISNSKAYFVNCLFVSYEQANETQHLYSKWNLELLVYSTHI